MYIPSDYYREFKAYCKEEFQNNNGIYDSFTDEQVEVIKDYFRWRSKRRVHELCRNTTLAVKPKKAEILSTLMGGVMTGSMAGACMATLVVAGATLAIL